MDKRLNLKAARVRKDLTQAELADLVGVSRQTIVEWEKGHTTPDITTANHIAEILEEATELLFPRKP